MFKLLLRLFGFCPKRHLIYKGRTMGRREDVMRVLLPCKYLSAFDVAARARMPVGTASKALSDAFFACDKIERVILEARFAKALAYVVKARDIVEDGG